MRGFDDKALLLFPNLSLYEEANTRYRFFIQKAALNMVKYLRNINMEPQAFLTDDLALKLPDLDLRYVSTLTRGDLFFATNNCDIPKNALQMDLVTYPDIVDEIAEKDKISADLDTSERFEHILTRDKKAITSIIPMYKVVINFYKKGSTRYRVVVKPNGGKIRLIVDASTFMIDAYINNVKENPIDLLGVDYGNKSLLNWEV